MTEHTQATSLGCRGGGVWAWPRSYRVGGMSDLRQYGRFVQVEGLWGVVGGCVWWGACRGGRVCSRRLGGLWCPLAVGVWLVGAMGAFTW